MLGHTSFPYVYLDATYLHVRETRLRQVVSNAVVVATGITATGGRDVLGLAVGDSEEETSWRAFLTDLRGRVCAESARPARRAGRRLAPPLAGCGAPTVGSISPATYSR